MSNKLAQFCLNIYVYIFSSKALHDFFSMFQIKLELTKQ